MRLTLLLCVALCSAVGTFAQVEKTCWAKSPQAWLGVGFRAGLGGVVVDEVVEGSPAHIAGIEIGDILRAVDGRAVLSTGSLVALIQSYSVGDSVRISIRRKGRNLGQLSAQLVSSIGPEELLRRRLVGKKAPEVFLGADLEGETRRLQNLRGKVVVLAFWSVACTRCQAIFEQLAALESSDSAHVKVFAITADRKGDVSEFLKSYAMPLKVLRDKYLRVHRAYRCERLVPTIVVIGPSGLIGYAATGASLDIQEALLVAKFAARQIPI